MSNYSDSSFDPDAANSSWYKVFHLIPEKSTVLDIGCSSGNFGAELIKRKKCTVDGIEIFEKDAELARKHLRDVWVLDIERDDLSDIKPKYDIVYFGDVVEHLVTPVESLARIKKLLKPTGKIIFSIPNMAHATVRLLLLKGDFDYTETGLLDKTHLHFYNQKEVYRVFESSGYEIDELSFVEKDYPNELLKDYAEEIGLTPNDKFYERMHRPDAAAFQFVGSASISKSPKKAKKLKQFGPIDMFESYYNNTINPLRERVEELEKSHATLEARNKQLEERWQQIKRQPAKFAVNAVRSKLKPKK